MSIFKFEFKRLLKSAIIWSVICGALIVLFMSLFPSMKNMGMQELVGSKMDALPSELLKAFNIETTMDFTNIFDYLSYAIQYIAMASAVYGAILGVNALIREESEGTIEFLYSKPIKRSKIVTTKLCSIASIFLVYIVIVGSFAMATCLIVKPDNVEVMDLIIKVKSIFIGIALLGYVFMAIGLLISSIIKSDKASIPVAIGIFFVTYFLGMIGKLKESFDWMKYLSPFDYYAPGEILKNGFDVTLVVVGIGIIVITTIGSYVIYNKKDMNI
jgi:ABC-2 type transport system permease protein